MSSENGIEATVDHLHRTIYGALLAGKTFTWMKHGAGRSQVGLCIGCYICKWVYLLALALHGWKSSEVSYFEAFTFTTLGGLVSSNW